MNALLINLLNDENGFMVSAELVLIATLGVLTLTVGLSEIGANLNSELMDVANAFGSINQSFSTQGQMGRPGSSFDNWNNGQMSEIMSGGSMGEQ